jgi:hypothetical protein
MKTIRRWQITVVVPTVLVLVGSGQVQGDFRFGEPANLGSTINTRDSELDPDISTDGLELYFQSSRTGAYGDSDIYVATRATTDDPWSEPVNLGPLVNSSSTEFGPNISADGLSLYFNSTRPGGSGQNDLYVAARKTVLEAWGEPVNLGPIVNTSFHDVNPSIAADGLSLFFSDWDGATPRPGGYGQCDIWMTQRASLSEPWRSPVNLGPQLNGPLVEGAADISYDGTVLFFSGYLSGADWDLWFARQNIDATWGPPVNLGPLVNTNSYADICPCISADGRMLYFSSFRSGGKGNSDIWQVPVIPTVDLNRDGIVDSVDLCIMTDHWGQNEPLCDIGPTPLGDGIVDAHDLVVLAEHLFEETLPLELVAYWKLDEIEGNIAYDYTGKYDAVLNGEPQWQSADGMAAGALKFNGIDNYLSTDFVLNPADGPFSLFAWIKGGAPGQVVIAQTDGVNWLSANPSEGSLMTELKGTGRSAGPLQSQRVITDGNWHHISIVWDGVFRMLYVDGMNVARDEQNILEGKRSGLYIGVGATFEAASFFSGLIDDVRIYDVAMRTEQIEAIAR